jgi:diacylglycerol kinase family enzyme
LALLLLAASLALAVVLAVRHFPRGLTVFACLVIAVWAGWFAVRRRGFARTAGAVLALLALAGAAVLLVVEGSLLGPLLVAVCFVAALAAGRSAFRLHVHLPMAPDPKRPVMFYNPRSGGGKAEKFHLADEARRRGIEAVELSPGKDLRELVRAAVADGADALAMAGGDGSQAIVAAIAAETGLPYACIPSGTRNHFALDLGVDRDDVVGALDALRGGGERVVDLAEVNGRVFVNNVSLGLYAEAVQKQSYRDAKLKTLLDTVPDALGPEAAAIDLHWERSSVRETGLAILVSNNGYRLARAIGSGTRPRMDEGVLGVAVFGLARPGASGHEGLSQWTTPTFEVSCESTVPAGIDGEATTLESPLRFRSRPAVLHVRIARSHPGASPSALMPSTPWKAITTMLGFAVGHDPASA